MRELLQGRCHTFVRLAILSEKAFRRWMPDPFVFALLLHVAAALRHHFKGDDVLVRMLPGKPR